MELEKIFDGVIINAEKKEEFLKKCKNLQDYGLYIIRAIIKRLQEKEEYLNSFIALNSDILKNIIDGIYNIAISVDDSLNTESLEEHVYYNILIGHGYLGEMYDEKGNIKENIRCIEGTFPGLATLFLSDKNCVVYYCDPTNNLWKEIFPSVYQGDEYLIEINKYIKEISSINTKFSNSMQKIIGKKWIEYGEDYIPLSETNFWEIRGYFDKLSKKEDEEDKDGYSDETIEDIIKELDNRFEKWIFYIMKATREDYEKNNNDKWCYKENGKLHVINIKKIRKIKSSLHIGNWTTFLKSRNCETLNEKIENLNLKIENNKLKIKNKINVDWKHYPQLLSYLKRNGRLSDNLENLYVEYKKDIKNDLLYLHDAQQKFCCKHDIILSDRVVVAYCPTSSLDGDRYPILFNDLTINENIRVGLNGKVYKNKIFTHVKHDCNTCPENIIELPSSSNSSSKDINYYILPEWKIFLNGSN